MADQNINWKQLEANINRTLLELPAQVGTAIVNWSKNRFRYQNWVDGGDFPWQPRKKGAKRNIGRAILINTGRLRRSIRIINASKNSVTVGTDVPYAAAHNEGFDGIVSVSSHQRRRFGKVDVYDITNRTKRKVKGVTGIGVVGEFKRHMQMPRRRFLGESKNMNDVIERLITQEIKKVLK